MNPKFGYLNLFFIVTIFVVATSCIVKHQGPTDTTESHIKISQIAASTGSVTISWIDDKGDNKNYKLEVYTDEACNDLYQSYNLMFDVDEENRFSVPYLDTSRKYYIRVENILGYKSKPFEVSLSIEPIRREVLYQNFDKLCWGYDYINLTNGIKLIDGKKPETYIIESLTDAIEDSEPTTSIDDHGGLLSKYKPAMLNLMGFESWPTGNKEVRIMPGYIRLGNMNSEGLFRTPAFSALEDKSENIDISFNAAIYAASLQAVGGKIELFILKGDGTTHTSKEFNLKSVNGKPSWNNCSLYVEDVTADCYCEIRTPKGRVICVDNFKIVRHLAVPEGYIYGYTYDKTSGKPISNVAVSDGFSVTPTDKDGLYMMKPHKDAWYIFYSTPANCEIIKSATGPLFYTRLEHGKTEYDFELKYLPNREKEAKFALFTFGDIQVSSNTALNRFKEEAAPAIKAHAKSMDIPCYGITLGDVVSTTDNKNAVPYMDDMQVATSSKYMGMQVFQVMGNHDCKHFNKENPLPTEPDTNGSYFEIKAQRAFENMFGPINYSFNRGDLHIIGMRDIVYTTHTTTGEYETGFLKEQYEWLKQDLALVPKDKMVVLCVHIPLYSKISKSGESGHYVKEVHDMLNEFAEAHIISGHTHIQYNHIHTTYDIYEHNMGTVCGSWWQSNICGDGTPNGYGVYICEGNTFSDWYYMGYAEGMNTREHQMRLYRGNAITGIERTNEKRIYSGYYQFNFGEDILLANVYNADSNWTIEVYEDDIYSGKMTKVKHKSVSFSKLVGDYTMDNPRRIDDSTISTYDMWVTGVHLSLNETITSGRGWTECKHLYQYQLKNPETENIKVRAVDSFGNEYIETKLTDYRDTKIAFKP